MVSVSVVIPTWNRSAHLERAIRSALEQSAAPLEVLVCDDGSTDDSEAIVRAIADPRVVWVPGTHAGRAAVPRNRGLQRCRGDWVAFLDSDDSWSADKLAKQLEFAQRYALDVVCTNATRVLKSGEEGGTLLSHRGPRIGLADLVYDNSVITSSVLARREAVLAVGGFPEDPALRVGEDYALWLCLAAEAPVGFLDQPLVRYLDSPDTSIRKYSPSAARQRELAVEHFFAIQRTRGRMSHAISRARIAIARTRALIVRVGSGIGRRLRRG